MKVGDKIKCKKTYWIMHEIANSNRLNKFLWRKYGFHKGKYYKINAIIPDVLITVHSGKWIQDFYLDSKFYFSLESRLFFDYFEEPIKTERRRKLLKLKNEQNT